MKKLYTLIFTSLLFPLITLAQTTNLPDSEKGISIDELEDIRRSNVESKEKIPSVQKLKIKVTDDLLIRQILRDDKKSLMGITWKSDYLSNPPAAIIREEDYDEKKK